KLARLSADAEGKTVAVLVPVISDQLVIPVWLSPLQHARLPTVHWTNVEVAYFKLRPVRPRNLKKALLEALEMQSVVGISRVEEIVRDCLGNERETDDSLTNAKDY